jgi:hypothetical protein
MPHACGTEYVLVYTVLVPVCTCYILYDSIVCTNASLCYTKNVQDMLQMDRQDAFCKASGKCRKETREGSKGDGS